MDAYALFSMKSDLFRDLTCISMMSTMEHKRWWVNFGAKLLSSRIWLLSCLDNLVHLRGLNAIGVHIHSFTHLEIISWIHSHQSNSFIKEFQSLWRWKYQNVGCWWRFIWWLCMNRSFPTASSRERLKKDKIERKEREATYLVKIRSKLAIRIWLFL